MDAVAAAAEMAGKPTTTRIYIGGLGDTVTIEDLRKIFSGLGTVERVDNFRTKGRNFAHVDFTPSSDKSLAKLFSAYNGCSWKGGKLKIEKPKEHYLDRLRREQAENVEMINGTNNISVDGHQNTVSSVKAASALDLEKLQIRMFFPKLGKVKPLPYKGTGKHKYSFQRIEIPALPVQFCACPDHSEAYLTSENVQVDHPVQKGGEINEEEISLMKSIMNKFIERENDSTACVEPPLPKQEDGKTLQHLPADENSTDDDDLIINVTHGHNYSFSSSQSGKQVPEFVNEDKSSNRANTSEDLCNTRKRKSSATDKKGESNYVGSHEKNSSPMPKRKGNLQKPSDLPVELILPLTSSHGFGANHQSTARVSRMQKSALGIDRNTVKPTQKATIDVNHDEKPWEAVFPTSSDSGEEISLSVVVNHGNIDSEGLRLKEPDLLSEARLPDHGSSKLVKGSSWLQKSSWTQLVGDANGGSFSISQILPGTKFKDLNLHKSNGPQTGDPLFLTLEGSMVNKRDGGVVHPIKEGSLNISKPSDATFSDKVEESCLPSGPRGEGGEKEQQDKISCSNKPSASKVEKVSLSEPVHTSLKTPEISQSCPFMRSAASLKEWKNTKAAVSSSLKEKKKKAPPDW